MDRIKNSGASSPQPALAHPATAAPLPALAHPATPAPLPPLPALSRLATPSLLLRLALALGYLWEVADRLGILGAHGRPHVGWGDWSHFMEYATQVMSFLPPTLVPLFAILATIGEAAFGLLLLAGLFTSRAAFGSGLLSLLFALAMAVSMGIESPVGYSVFTVSAASFLLAALPADKWSLDRLIKDHLIKK